MTLKTMMIILAIVGFTTVIAGYIIGSQNSGSCPANQSGCDHTFPGTNIRIGATANVISVSGLAILAAALAVAIYSRISRPSSKVR